MMLSKLLCLSSLLPLVRGEEGYECSDLSVQSVESGSWFNSNIWSAEPNSEVSVEISKKVVLGSSSLAAQAQHVTISEVLTLESYLLIEDTDCKPICDENLPCEDSGNACFAGNTCRCKTGRMHTDVSEPITLNGEGSFGNCADVMPGYEGGSCLQDNNPCLQGRCSSKDICIVCPEGKSIDTTMETCAAAADGEYITPDGEFAKCHERCHTCKGPTANDCTIHAPSKSPTGSPTKSPTVTEKTAAPSISPSVSPSFSPTVNIDYPANTTEGSGNTTEEDGDNTTSTQVEEEAEVTEGPTAYEMPMMSEAPTPATEAPTVIEVVGISAAERATTMTTASAILAGMCFYLL